MSSPAFRSRWDLKTAVKFVRMLHTQLAPHYDVALCGGVLYTGSSTKDVDVAIYPTCSTRFDRAEVAKLLRLAGLEQVDTVIAVHARWREYGSRDEKHLEVWSYRGRRVDCFMWSGL